MNMYIWTGLRACDIERFIGLIYVLVLMTNYYERDYSDYKIQRMLTLSNQADK